MNVQGWLQIALYCLLVFALTKPVGVYLFRVFEESGQPLKRILSPIERLLYRIMGVEADKEQDWVGYAVAMGLFSAVSIAICYAVFRLQALLPLNPASLGSLEDSLAINTAVSFATNTNWQSYAGESTMSHLCQMLVLTWQNFVSAGVGLGVALALCRGLTRRRENAGELALGNFWVDLTRATLYVFLPVCAAYALVQVGLGVTQTFSGPVSVNTLEGGNQVIALGPVASQEAIKILGVNGGGFFNANSAHPFENPTPLANFLQMLAIFAIPAGLTYTFGLMAGDRKQGWSLFAAMMALFLAGAAVCYWAEASPNPSLAGLSVTQSGNMEGKETRFGVAGSALYATVTTDASCGAVNSMHDSFTPLGGMVPLTNILLGEVIFGGVGSGLYGILVYALLAVFIAGLMVGRTPEYLGKKIEVKEIKLTVAYILIFPLVILGLTAWAVSARYGVSSASATGAHGLSQILYAYASAAGNNGSAFAGLNANTPWWNLSLSVAMLFGRYAMMVPVLALAGSMVGKKTVPETSGTFPTGGITFVALLIGVIVIVGALTFFPALTLGPVLEHFISLGGLS